MVAQRDETPALLDEGGRANVIGVQHRTLPREFRRRRLLRVGGDLLVAIDELANVVLQQIAADTRSEEHTSELQSQSNLVCRLLLEKKKKSKISHNTSLSRCE